MFAMLQEPNTLLSQGPRARRCLHIKNRCCVSPWGTGAHPCEAGGAVFMDKSLVRLAVTSGAHNPMLVSCGTSRQHGAAKTFEPAPSPSLRFLAKCGWNCDAGNPETYAICATEKYPVTTHARHISAGVRARIARTSTSASSLAEMLVARMPSHRRRKSGCSPAISRVNVSSAAWTCR